MAGLNLLTDVAGLTVGHAEDAKVLSGVTVVCVEAPSVASVTTRGGAPGSRDTTLLDPAMTAQGVDAIVLSGGSLYGLDAAGGVVNYLRRRGVGFGIGGIRVPLAAQAIVFDLLNGGDKEWGRMPPYWDLGWAAAEAARDGPFALGSVGGGLGATTANFKGGLGSASTVTTGGFYAACKASFEAEDTGTLSVDINGATFTGDGIVDGISTPTPADGAVTCSVTFKMSSWTYAPPTT